MTVRRRPPTLRCALLIAGAAILGGVPAGCGAGARRSVPAATRPAGAPAVTTPAAGRPERAGSPPYAVGEVTLTFVDHSRTVELPGVGVRPRTLVTVIRYPSAGPASDRDRPGLPPDRAGGPFPLVVFGHGFAVTPATYWRLLHAWAAAGFVVAAPVFPLENAHAPGGPDERDLANQPADVRFVITRTLAALRGVIDPREIAVSGQSDGSETALAVAYDPRFRDPRIRAAVLLSGAQPFGGLRLTGSEPPLLAVHGTADPVVPFDTTEAFFALARPPKYLLELLDAGHLPPYTTEEPQLGIVERATIGFLRAYLAGRRSGLSELRRAGDQPGVARLLADPAGT